MIPKFRAWDKVNEEMFEVTGLDFLTQPYRVFYKENGESKFSQDTIIMQCSR